MNTPTSARGAALKKSGLTELRSICFLDEGRGNVVIISVAYEFKARRRVEFSETDMAGIVHFSNFFKYMETVEHGFYRSLGYSVNLEQFTPPLGFPRVHASCDYRKPLRFEDLLEIHLLVKEKRTKALTYQLRFNKVSSAGGVETLLEVARGALTIVCAAHLPDGRLEAAAIPQELADLIQPAPAEFFH